MADWDDDSFEVDIKQIDEKKINVIEEFPDEHPAETVPKTTKTHVTHTKSKGKNALKTFSGDLDRELTESEKIAMQRKSDLSFARELFGEEEEADLSELSSPSDFRNFGEEIGEKLAGRAGSAYYVDMLAALLKTATVSMESSKVRTLSNLLKTLADEKSTKEKEEKRPKGKGGSNKPSLKGLQKSNKINIDEYRDYEYTDDFDIEDDFM
ncbi:unnamed protein product [Enterobius vermicularis]|uniref:Eukaryotic translation initiation factor 3 30 kDa subunit n=1 Tax=Enterobius vermicularis TaxID=51028 RepID=A0A0N4UYY1_ENTVE|nr:unnamed protein product [Enterobius vermicularis]